jgi:hypothetical protein
MCPPGTSFYVSFPVAGSPVGYCTTSAGFTTSPLQLPLCPPPPPSPPKDQTKPPMQPARPSPPKLTDAKPPAPPTGKVCNAGFLASPIYKPATCKDGNIPTTTRLCPDGTMPSTCPAVRAESTVTQSLQSAWRDWLL